METKLILGLVFLLNAWTMSMIVGPWYLGLPFFTLGLVFLAQSFNSNDSIQENMKNEETKK